jgi:hypothetical protein
MPNAFVYCLFIEGRYILLTHDEFEQTTEKIFSKFKFVPGIDKNFIQKCLQGITSLGDAEVDEKIK